MAMRTAHSIFCTGKPIPRLCFALQPTSTHAMVISRMPRKLSRPMEDFFSGERCFSSSKDVPWKLNKLATPEVDTLENVNDDNEVEDSARRRFFRARCRAELAHLADEASTLASRQRSMLYRKMGDDLSHDQIGRRMKQIFRESEVLLNDFKAAGEPMDRDAYGDFIIIAGAAGMQSTAYNAYNKMRYEGIEPASERVALYGMRAAYGGAKRGRFSVFPSVGIFEDYRCLIAPQHPSESLYNAILKLCLLRQSQALATKYFREMVVLNYKVQDSKLPGLLQALIECGDDADIEAFNQPNCRAESDETAAAIIKVYSSNGYLDQAFHFYQRFRSVLIRPRRIPYQAYPKKLNHMKHTKNAVQATVGLIYELVKGEHMERAVTLLEEFLQNHSEHEADLKAAVITRLAHYYASKRDSEAMMRLIHASDRLIAAFSDEEKISFIKDLCDCGMLSTALTTFINWGVTPLQDDHLFQLLFDEISRASDVAESELEGGRKALLDLWIAYRRDIPNPQPEIVDSYMGCLLLFRCYDELADLFREQENPSFRMISSAVLAGHFLHGEKLSKVEDILNILNKRLVHAHAHKLDVLDDVLIGMRVMLQVGRSDAVWNLWEAIQKSKLGLFHLRTRSDIFDCVVRGLVDCGRDPKDVCNFIRDQIGIDHDVADSTLEHAVEYCRSRQSKYAEEIAVFVQPAGRNAFS